MQIHARGNWGWDGTCSNWCVEEEVLLLCVVWMAGGQDRGGTIFQVGFRHAWTCLWNSLMHLPIRICCVSCVPAREGHWMQQKETVQKTDLSAEIKMKHGSGGWPGGRVERAFSQVVCLEFRGSWVSLWPESKDKAWRTQENLASWWPGCWGWEQRQAQCRCYNCPSLPGESRCEHWLASGGWVGAYLPHLVLESWYFLHCCAEPHSKGVEGTESRRQEKGLVFKRSMWGQSKANKNGDNVNLSFCFILSSTSI